MKKLFIGITLLFCLILSGCSSSKIANIILKTEDTKTLPNITIDANYISYYITPSGFEYEKLEKLYSYMTITVEYTVSYKRTFSGWDIFYAGKPKYDICIKNIDDYGIFEDGLETKSEPAQRTISYTSSLADMKNNRIIFEVGSINIQNNVIFSDIEITYKVK